MESASNVSVETARGGEGTPIGGRSSVSPGAVEETPSSWRKGTPKGACPRAVDMLHSKKGSGLLVRGLSAFPGASNYGCEPTLLLLVFEGRRPAQEECK